MAASYEVTDGTRTLGTFSSQAKADALKKELKAQGVKARVRIVHEEPKGRKSKSAPEAPKKPVKAKRTARSNPVPKKTSKTPQKPKETPKTGKTDNANAPKDYKGPLIPAEDILDMFEQHVYCTEVETGITSEVMIKYGTVSVMEKGQYGYDLKAVYANSKLESDGKYLRVTYKGVDHWFVIHADEKVSAPTIIRRRPAVDYSTCSIEQLADVLYQIQEVHVTNRRWYDRDAPHEPNPVLSRDEILNALITPEKAVALCDAYLHCYVSSYSEFWGGWDENTISYNDWKAIEKRLAGIRADAKKAIPSQPPAPVKKPKKRQSKKKSKAEFEAQTDLYKRLGRILQNLNTDGRIPVSWAEFNVCDFHRSAIIQFTSTDGMSFFGLPDDPSFTGAIWPTFVGQDIDRYFDADGNLNVARLKADAGYNTCRQSKKPNLKFNGHYTIDSNGFRTALNHASKVIGKNRFKRTRPGNGSFDAICFYDDGRGNLMMRSESQSKGKDGRPEYEIVSNIGNGRGMAGPSYYESSNLFILADLMSLSDGYTCEVRLDGNYPLSAKLRIGGFDVEMIIMPCEMMD